MIRDIKPKTPVAVLRRDFTKSELQRRFDVELVCAAVGMSRAFIARAFGVPGGRPRTATLEQVLFLLDLDGFQETFLPRSRIPDYLLNLEITDPPTPLRVDNTAVLVGNARDLLPALPEHAVQSVVTSSPYWGMRTYDNQRDVKWADGEMCPYGFEQTPEGFIRHTIELLYLLKPALALKGSVWWNLMDTYNTRTPIRGNARERMSLMDGTSTQRHGWTEHAACRHSAGHMYLQDAEQCSIPLKRVAERASRIGYMHRSSITWRKNSATPEPVNSRVTRQAEYILHLSVGQAPFFDKEEWQTRRGPEPGAAPTRSTNPPNFTDVWSLPTAVGKNGHGARIPPRAPRSVYFHQQPPWGDLVLDPFIGSGTTAIAALALGRKCIGFDVSEKYVESARARVARALATGRPASLWELESDQSRDDTTSSRSTARRSPDRNGKAVLVPRQWSPRADRTPRTERKQRGGRACKREPQGEAPPAGTRIVSPELAGRSRSASSHEACPFARAIRPARHPTRRP